MTGNMAANESRGVPKAARHRYEELVALTDTFCRERLNEEYAALARRALSALARKRPTPIQSGQAKVWACAVVYALGQMNFLADKSNIPYLSTQDLCAGFGVGVSTAGLKAKAVRQALGMHRWDHHWMLAEHLASTPLIWMVDLDGLIVDVRHLARPIQVAAHEAGLIPYLPADGPAGDGGTREPILGRYDAYRWISNDHHQRLAARLLDGPITREARRLGLVDKRYRVREEDLDDIAAAADFAIYDAREDGVSAVERYVREMISAVSEPEKRVLGAMGAATFSIYRVVGCHRGAGLDLIDLVSGELVWMVDRALEATADEGLELAMRLFRPEDFAMQTGAAVEVDRRVWNRLETTGVVHRRTLPKPSLDRSVLAEAIYRLTGSTAAAA